MRELFFYCRITTGDVMKIVIIGSGPCGLVSAITIKKSHPDYEVVILEKDKGIGSRIKISGNGRCNFINKNLKAEDYSSSFSAHIIKYQDEVMKLFDEAGLLYYFDEQGRAYPYSESSSTIISCFNYLLDKYKVEVKTSYLVKSIQKQGTNFLINDDIKADKIVVAIGGISYLNEKLNYNRIVSDLDLKVTSLTPSLAPISVTSFPKELENKKVKCEVRLLKKHQEIFKERGEVLFKKDGLSGIVIFNLSAYLARTHTNNFNDYEVSLNLLPDIKDEELKTLISKNPTLERIFIEPLANLISKSNNKIDTIRNLKFGIRGIYEFKNSQVTSGGVELNQINDNLSLKKDRDIFVGGEFIDLDGVCGGYNIGLAMCSGYLIGKSI